MVVGSIARGCQAVVIGGGPGGYVAALRLARLGKDVILIEKQPQLGGVCLNEGCIPSKALIHVSDLYYDLQRAKPLGVTAEKVSVDISKMVEWKDGIVSNLSKGIQFLCQKSGVDVIHGTARFVDEHNLLVDTGHSQLEVNFEHAIIATGSKPFQLSQVPFDQNLVISSTEALSPKKIPKRIVIIGAGYIGLELGSFYAKLGTKVQIVELMSQILPDLDNEVALLMTRSLKDLGIEFFLGHKASDFEVGSDSVKIKIVGAEDSPRTLEADQLLVCVGRKPYTENLGLEKIGVKTTEKGFVFVDEQQRTSTRNIFAVGDVVGGVMLAHKAYKEGKVAAEVIAGQKSAFDSVSIPSVVYTDPEIAWTGKTEKQVRAENYNVSVGKSFYKSSGRALTKNSGDGFVKVIADKDSGQILGVTAVGRDVSEIIGEATLALELGAHLEDIGFTIHPHPTMNEALQEATEIALGRGVH